jgi:hypothetical protein
MIFNVEKYVHTDSLLNEMLEWCKTNIGPQLSVENSGKIVGEGWSFGLKTKSNNKTAAIFIFTFDDEGDAIQFKILWPLCTKE